MVGGVNTGTLAPVGSAFSPTVTPPLGRRYLTSQTIGGSTTPVNTVFDGLNAVFSYNDAFHYVANLLGLDLDELYLENFNGTAQSSLLKDALGSTTALAGSSQSLTDTYTYEPYGISTHFGTSINGSLFAGQAYDFNNLYFMRNRYYLPSIARFVSRDPLGGVNPYLYAGDSPTNFTDPTGILCHVPRHHLRAAANRSHRISSCASVLQQLLTHLESGASRELEHASREIRRDAIR